MAALNTNAEAIKNKIANNNFYSTLDEYEGSYIDNDDFSKYIHANLDLMDSKEMGRNVLNILSHNQLKNILLDYELAHFEEEPININLDEFKKKAMKILNRYRRIEKSLEDEWTVYTCNDHSDEYHVKKNEILFDNTAFNWNVHIRDYMEKIIKRLNMISTKVKSHYGIEKGNGGICNVMIWCTFST